MEIKMTLEMASRQVVRLLLKTEKTIMWLVTERGLLHILDRNNTRSPIDESAEQKKKKKTSFDLYFRKLLLTE